jgi:hypothetical protein
MANDSFYVLQSKKLLRDLNKFAKPMLPKLETLYGFDVAISIYQETLTEFDKLIPQFPYVGGKENRLTANLIQAGYGLALYRALERHGGGVYQAGELCHLALEHMLFRIPAFARKLLGKIKFSPRKIIKMKEYAQLSQRRRYPEDWVWELIEGDGGAFDFGITYTECGIEKFLRRQGASDFTPYLCNTDYVLFSALGMELVRTKTLAWGCDCCDFRIKMKGKMPPAWPPRFVERECNNQKQ